MAQTATGWLVVPPRATRRDILNIRLAEREGFEPSVGFHRHRFSRPAQSATLSPLRRAVRSLYNRIPDREGVFNYLAKVTPLPTVPLAESLFSGRCANLRHRGTRLRIWQRIFPYDTATFAFPVCAKFLFLRIPLFCAIGMRIAL